jgi:trehalose-6-phosphate synthase
MHPISGVENKLRAFYNFLDQNPKKVNQVILIQYTVPLKTANDEIRNH